jgi:hypothetical protein
MTNSIEVDIYMPLLWRERDSFDPGYAGRGPVTENLLTVAMRGVS